jgi:hypothetical protein
MKELQLPWTKLKEKATDWLPGTIGKKARLIGRIRLETDKENFECYIKLH